MKKRILLTLSTLTLISGAALGQRKTVFQTSFEYGSFDAEPAVFEPADLDGADDQVGSWSGDELPDAVGGDINIPPEASIGFVNNPYDGGRAMLLDRPGPNFDEENFVGSLDANLSDSVLLLGAQVSFEIGTRRTNGNNNKDWDIVGLGSDGSESFRLRVGTNNNGGERLGYVSDGSVVFDLPTVVGEDRANDLNNTGYNRNLEGPYADVFGGPAAAAEFPFVQLSLGAEGYTVELAHQELNTSDEANAYKTAVLPYNGDAMDLATIQFTYNGNSNTGINTGWFLDNFAVTGFEEILQGDFDGDGSIGFSDFLILANNFGQATSDGDYDFSGIVDLNDWLGFKAAYSAANPGGAGEAASVPEPTSGLLIFVGALLSLQVRRRRACRVN